ncbi:MAG: hypothetical protein ABII12_07445 [Planctomycetota bacterium]
MPAGQAATARRLAPMAFALACTSLVLCGVGCADPEGVSPRERSRLSVIRDERPGTVRIEGIGPIRGFTRGRDNTFVHCLELILDAAGREIGYDELMGISGMAFRVQFRVDRWDVGNPDPLVGEDCLPALFEGIGWEYEVWIVRRDEFSEADALRRAIEQSISLNRLPVLAANIMPPEDWGIITGYRRDRTWLCRAYNPRAMRQDCAAKGWPTAVVLLNRQLNRPDPKLAHKASIRRAIELFDKRSARTHALGPKAFDEWCHSLRSARDAGYVHANFWTYVNLIDSRSAAVRYLRSIAKEFGSRATHVNAAADEYDKEVRALLDGLKDVATVERYPDSLPPAGMRDKQINSLKKAKAFEQEAITSLRKAV